MGGGLSQVSRRSYGIPLEGDPDELVPVSRPSFCCGLRWSNLKWGWAEKPVKAVGTASVKAWRLY